MNRFFLIGYPRRFDLDSAPLSLASIYFQPTFYRSLTSERFRNNRYTFPGGVRFFFNFNPISLCDLIYLPALNISYANLSLITRTVSIYIRALSRHHFRYSSENTAESSETRREHYHTLYSERAGFLYS